ncbi:tetratricopeptide repeat protein [Pajaroellobacter abortibovis]|uniref:Tetratricopeptide repeat protein n=1 Tax=Pajaroellobacter abortibovis TaxID=1882918 RepID=A0A1L6MYH6_9BACT|nr:hypothetical protein [Pajaroellobacter abortibovis]APS00458.1 hypothetical protein BCY86_07045 [Pajaroellobacter abortibovis]
MCDQRKWVWASVVLLLWGCAHTSSSGGGISDPKKAGTMRMSVPLSMRTGLSTRSQALFILLLNDPRADENVSLLVQVVPEQMRRAAFHFAERRPEQGLRAFYDVLYLVNLMSDQRELTHDVLGPYGVEVLRSAIKEVARAGDEGRAWTFYELLSQVGSSADRASAREHLIILKDWLDQTMSGGPISRASVLARFYVQRYFLRPTADSKEGAVRAVRAWVEQALALRDSHLMLSRGELSRSEAEEGTRALRMGATLLASIYLYDRDPSGAISTLLGSRISEILPRELLIALQSLTIKQDATAYLHMARLLRAALEVREGQWDKWIGSDWLMAVLFQLMKEAYRLDPTLPEAAEAVALALQTYGLGEATAPILLKAIKAHPESHLIEGSLGLIMRAMGLALELEEEEQSARAVYQSAQPFFDFVEEIQKKSQVQFGTPIPLQPGLEHIHIMMGKIELRSGQMEEARFCFYRALEKERLAEALLPLARIEWHQGYSSQALAKLDEAMQAQDAIQSPMFQVHVLFYRSDMAVEKGRDAAAVRDPLVKALKAAKQAREWNSDEVRADAERMLCRILDRFGEAELARKALDRALEATPTDKNQLSETLSLQISRSLVHGNLAEGREGLGRALSFDLKVDMLVYYALWVRLLERRLNTSSDGVADRVFDLVLEEQQSWIGRLAAFGAGRIQAEALGASAVTPIQRAEASFYMAMDKLIAGDKAGAAEGFKEVLEGPGMELVEFSVARDFLKGWHSELAGLLPEEEATHLIQ